MSSKQKQGVAALFAMAGQPARSWYASMIFCVLGILLEAFPYISIYHIIRLVLTAAQARSHIESYLDMLNLANLKNRHPASLSGGQKQRVLLAAAALRPSALLVLDEPTSGLDGLHMEKTAMLSKSMAVKGSSIVLITHDMELIQRCVGRIVHILTVLRNNRFKSSPV